MSLDVPDREYVDLENLTHFSKLDEDVVSLIGPFIQDTISAFFDRHIKHVRHREVVVQTIVRWFNNKWSRSIREIIAVEYQEHLLHHSVSSDVTEYKNFLKLLATSDARKFIFEKYPVFKDRLKSGIDLFSSFLAELLERFQTDQGAILENIFSIKVSDTTHLELLEILLAGDTHNRGRSVTVVTVRFQDQIYKVVYKPRDPMTDLALNEFYHFLNISLVYSLKIPTIIPRKDYFWTEYFKYAGCNDRGEIEEFYYRFGVLVFVCYALDGNDIHFENLIASGNIPVILDCECFFYPCINWRDDETYIRTTISTALDSMILASRKDQKELSAFLGLKFFKEVTQKQVRVDASGHVRIEESSIHIGKNQKRNKPFLIASDEEIEPIDYLDKVILGFSDAYQTLLKNSMQLLEQKQFLHYVSASKTRLVFRSTFIYLKLLKNTYHVSNLNDYTKYYDELGWISKNPLFPRKNLDLCFSESAQLMQGDVPTFYYDATLKKVIDGYGNDMRIEVVVSGMQSFLKRVEEDLSEQDLNAQVELIKQAVAIYQYNTDELTENHV